MKELFNLTGNVALVLGVGKTGRSLASALQDFGALTVLSDSAAKLAGTETNIQIPANLDCGEALAELAGEIIQRHGRIDILVNAWEPFRQQAAVDVSVEDWMAYVRVPIRSTFLSCQIFGSIMLKQGSGSIINLSSVAGSLGFAEVSTYSACKGGIDQLTRTLGVEWVKRGVRVNGIASWGESLSGMEDPPWRKRVPSGSLASGSDLAGTAVYLASSASRNVTGQILFVDGGYSAQ